jgi:hypothetical protein
LLWTPEHLAADFHAIVIAATLFYVVTGFIESKF